MQIPFEVGDKMEVSLFEKREHFFITSLIEYRDGAGFPFKTVEIGKTEKPKAPSQISSKKEAPALTMNMKKQALPQTPRPQIAAAKPAPPKQTQHKTVAAGSVKQVAGGSTKQVAGSNAKQLPAGGAKQVSANESKKLTAKDAIYLPAKKR